MTHWRIDAVLSAGLSTGQMRLLAKAAEAVVEDGCRRDGGLAVTKELDHFAQMAFRVDRRGERNLIGVVRMDLGEGLKYHSADDRLVSHCGMGSDDTGSSRVHFPCGLTVTGVVPPETVMAELHGRHVSAIVDHPLLQHGSLIIGRTSMVGSPACRGEAAEWTGFHAVLPQIHVPMS